MSDDFNSFLEVRLELGKDIDYGLFGKADNFLLNYTGPSLIKTYFEIQLARMRNEFDEIGNHFNMIDITNIASPLKFVFLVEHSYMLWLKFRSSEVFKDSLASASSYFDELPENYKESCTEENATLLNLIGNDMWVSGNLKSSLEFYNKSFHIRSTLDRPRALAVTQHNIGLLYYNFGELDKAEEYMSKSLQLVSTIEASREISLALHTLGEIYIKKSNLDLALEYLNLALDYKIEINDQFMLANVYFDLILVNLLQADNKSADDHLGKIEALLEKQEDKKLKNQLESLHSLSKALILKSKNRLKHMVKAQQILKELIHSENLDHEKKIIAMQHLAEVMLDELKILENDQILTNLTQLISEMSTIAYESSMLGTYIQSQVLRSKISFAVGSFDDAIQKLDDAFEKANLYGLTHIQASITIAKTQVLNDLNNIDKKLKHNKNFLERMKMVDLDDYLKRITHMMKE